MSSAVLNMPSVRTPVVARYSCRRCTAAGITCLIPPGLRTCVYFTRVRRKCMTRRSSTAPTTSIRDRVESIRTQLFSILASLRTIDNSDDGDPTESTVDFNSIPGRLFLDCPVRFLTSCRRLIDSFCCIVVTPVPVTSMPLTSSVAVSELSTADSLPSVSSAGTAMASTLSAEPSFGKFSPRFFFRKCHF